MDGFLAKCLTGHIILWVYVREIYREWSDMKKNLLAGMKRIYQSSGFSPLLFSNNFSGKTKKVAYFKPIIFQPNENEKDCHIQRFSHDQSRAHGGNGKALRSVANL